MPHIWLAQALTALELVGEDNLIAKLQLQAQLYYRQGKNAEAINLYNQLYQKHKVTDFTFLCSLSPTFLACVKLLIASSHLTLSPLPSLSCPLSHDEGTRCLWKPYYMHLFGEDGKRQTHTAVYPWRKMWFCTTSSIINVIQVSTSELHTNVLAAYISGKRGSEVPAVMEAMKITAKDSPDVAFNKACSLMESQDYEAAESELLLAQRLGKHCLPLTI